MIYHILLAFVVTFIITVVLGKIGIPMLRSLHAQQSIREEGPESHQAKAGTPTMGGAFMMVALIIGVALFAPWNVGTGMLLFLTLGHCLLGFFDDFVKAVKKRNLGLTAKQKLLGQFILAAVFCYCITEIMVVPTTLWIPVVDIQLQLGWGYYVLAFLIIVGATNAVNLTDGLDGLAIMPTALVAGAFALIAWATGNVNFAEYLHIPYIKYSSEVVVFCTAIVGAGLGFLWFNTYPAQVFMGDVGSLALGGALGVVAILVRQEFLLVIMGGVFVVEALSVILQVGSYKLRKQRIFRMAPIHHHFELKGWPEPRVIIRFWIISLMLVLMGLVTLKLR